MGWTTGVRFPAGAGTFFFATVSRPAVRPTQPPIQSVPGALSLRVKAPDCEADHSAPSSAEVKNTWNYTSTPPYVVMACCLVKHRDNFALYFVAKIVLSVLRLYVKEITLFPVSYCWIFYEMNVFYSVSCTTVNIYKVCFFNNRKRV
jgi:hypothetical protein